MKKGHRAVLAFTLLGWPVLLAVGGTGTVPAAPTEFHARAISSNRVVFSWRGNATDETGYRLERTKGGCSAPGVWVKAAGLVSNTTVYSLGDLSAGTLYSFRLKARGTGETRAIPTASRSRPPRPARPKPRRA